MQLGEFELNDILKQFRKKYEDAIISVGSDEKLKLRRFSTEIDVLDKILGGGIPFGRVILVYGDYSAGKSYICQMITKAAQHQGLSAALVDVEKTFDPAWHLHSGVDIDKLLLVQPTHGEQALDVVVDLIKAKVNLVVLDSVAALIPASSLEESTEEKRIGELARLFNNGLKKIVAANHHGESVFIAINQPRAGIGGYIPTEALPAGKGQWFFSSIVLRVGRGGFVKEKVDGKEIKTGFVMKISTEKNKTEHPFQTCELMFNYMDGAIDSVSGAVEVALDHKIILQKGPYFYYGDQKWQGKLGLIDSFKNDLELLAKLREDIKKA